MCGCRFSLGNCRPQNRRFEDTYAHKASSHGITRSYAHPSPNPIIPTTGARAAAILERLDARRLLDTVRSFPLHRTLEGAGEHEEEGEHQGECKGETSGGAAVYDPAFLLPVLGLALETSQVWA